MSATEAMAMLAAAIAPAIILLAYFAATMRPPMRPWLLITAFLVGTLAPMIIGPTLIIEAWIAPQLDPMPRAWVVAGVFAGLFEEAIKLILLLGVAMRHSDARAAGDVIPTAAAVALGFAFFENCLYIVGDPDWTRVAWVRACTAVPMHALLGALMGAFLYWGAKANRPAFYLGALFAPAGLHMLYDAPLFIVDFGAAAPESWGGWSALFLLAYGATLLLGFLAAVDPDRDQPVGHGRGHVLRGPIWRSLAVFPIGGAAAAWRDAGPMDFATISAVGLFCLSFAVAMLRLPAR